MPAACRAHAIMCRSIRRMRPARWPPSSRLPPQLRRASRWRWRPPPTAASTSRDGNAAVAHVALKTRGAAPGPAPAARRGRRRPPASRSCASRCGARPPRRSGSARSAARQPRRRSGRGWRARATPTAKRRSASRSTRDRVLEFQTASGVTRCDGVAGAAVPARLRLRQRPLPPGHVAAARAGRREAGRAPGQSRDARRPAAGRVSLDRGVEHARVGQRRARAGLARRAERRRRRHHLGRGHGRRRARRVRHRAVDRRRLRGARPAHLPGRRRQPGGVPRQEPRAAGSRSRSAPRASSASTSRSRPTRPPTPRTGAIRSGCRCPSRCRRRA